MFKVDLEKAEEPEIKLAISVGLLKKQENSRKKKSTYCLLTTAKPLIVCLSQTVGNSSRDGNIRPPYLPPGVANGQEATVRTGHGKIDCLQIEKGICQLDIVTLHI